MTQQERIAELIAGHRANAEAHGTSVRCPECGAGAGKFCRVDMRDTAAAKNSRIVLHEARVKAAEAKRLMDQYAAADALPRGREI